MMSKAEDPLDIRKGVFANPFEADDGEGSAEDLAGFGMKIRKSEKMTPVYRSASRD